LRQKRRMSASGHSLLGRLSAPVLFGLAAFLSTPTITSHADMTAMLAGGEGSETRWKTNLTASPAGSIQAAEVTFADPILTSSTVSGAGVILPNGDKIAFQGKIGAADERPDAERVTRHLKKGRVVAVAPVSPPKDFSAGSVLERQSNLLRPTLDGNEAMAFLKPDIRGKEIEIATAFYTKGKPKRDPQVPAMLASLVTNDNPDILATAYAPPKPDYARQSPFSSVLREETRRGRFIPPVTPGGPRMGRYGAACAQFLRIRAALPCSRDLFRGARRIRRRPGRRCAGDSQPGPKPDLSEPSAVSSTRTNPGAIAASFPSPATESRTGSVHPNTGIWPRKSRWRPLPARSGSIRWALRPTIMPPM
jgi:hypothetical protein